MAINKIFLAIVSQAAFLLTALPLHAQWSVAHLSEPRERPYPVVAGSKVLFALGSISSSGTGNKVDIYDTNTGLWTVHNLPFVNEDCINPNPPVVANDGRVFFVDENNITDEIQIYNAIDNSWTTATLSEPRGLVSIGVAGDYVVFAGGFSTPNLLSATVDLYNVKANSWHVAQLSEPRFYIAITGLGNKVFMGGGFKLTEMSDRVDILNTDNWTSETSTLVEKRGLIEAVTVGNKVLLAGGGLFDFVFFNQVDIYDGDTGTWSSDSVTQYNYGGIMKSAVVGNRAYFHGIGGEGDTDIFDVYDATTGGWNTIAIPTSHVLGAFTSAGNKLYLAGGVNDFNGVVEVYDCNSGLWDTLGYLSIPRYWVGGAAAGNKLLLGGGYGGGYSDVVDIYTGISSSATKLPHLALQPPFPNPAHDRVHIPLPADATMLRVFDVQGRLMRSEAVKGQVEKEIELKDFAPGLYMVAVEGNEAVHWGKIVVE